MQFMCEMRTFVSLLASNEGQQQQLLQQPAPQPQPEPAPQQQPVQTRAPGTTSRPLWVVCAYFNPCNYENRRTNYEIFAANLRRQGVPLCTVEMAAHEHTLQLRDGCCDLYVRVISPDVLWAKECLLNIGARRLPPSCTIVCWADADLVWAQDDWAQRTERELLVPNGPVVVQPFARATNMKKDERFETHYQGKEEAAPTALPMGKSYSEAPRSYVIERDIYKYHAGYAWAMRREVFEAIGGLYEHCILGQADFVMAIAFSHDPARDGAMGDVWLPDATFNWGPGLLSHARKWQQRTSEIVRGRFAYVKGLHVFHNWHGDPHDRRYSSRGRLLCDYVPATDIARHPVTGALMWTIEARNRKLPVRVMDYFENRKEDGRSEAEVQAREADLARQKQMMMMMRQRGGLGFR